MATDDAHILRKFAFLIRTEVDKAAIKKFDKSIDKVKRGWKELGQRTRQGLLQATVAAGAFAGVLTKITVDTAREGDAAAKTAKQLQVGLQAYQEWTHAGKLAGAEAADINIAFKTLARNAEAASRGTGEAVEALKGIQLTQDGKLRSLPELLDDIADRAMNAKDGTKLLADAQRIFGESGGKLIPLLRQGSAAIRAQRREISELGAVFDEEGAAQAERFQDQMLRLQTVAKGLRNEIGLALMPVVSDLTDDVLGWVRANRQLLRSRLRQFAKGVGNGLRTLGRIFENLDRIVTNTVGSWDVALGGLITTIAALLGVNAIGGLVPAIATLASGLGGVLALILGISGGLATLIVVLVGGALIVTIGQLAAVIAFTVLVLEDMQVTIAGGDSMMRRFIETLREGGPELQALARYLDEVVLLYGDLQTALLKFLNNAWNAFTIGLQDAQRDAEALLKTLREIANFVLSFAGTDLAGVLDQGTGVLRQVRGGVRQFGDVNDRAVVNRGMLRAMNNAQREQERQRSAERSRQLMNLVNNLQVSVDARGQQSPGSIGTEVGFSVDRALRALQADLLTGAP